jgi:hypothetical protein
MFNLISTLLRTMIDAMVILIDTNTVKKMEIYSNKISVHTGPSFMYRMKLKTMFVTNETVI